MKKIISKQPTSYKVKKLSIIADQITNILVLNNLTLEDTVNIFTIILETREGDK